MKTVCILFLLVCLSAHAAESIVFTPSSTVGVTNYSIYYGPLSSRTTTNRVHIGGATSWPVSALGTAPASATFIFATAWATNGVESDPSNEIVYTNLSHGRLVILDSQLDRYTNNNTWNNLEIKYAEFETNSCALQEGCVSGVGWRKLLALRITIYNPSTEPGEVWFGPGDQSLYSYDSCHNHVHLQNFSSFELLSSAGLVAVGRKIGWCVQSLYRINDLIWNTNVTSGDCWAPRMDPGWADTYQFSGQPCMYLDITDVPDGYYVLKVSIDPLRLFSNAYDSISRIVKIQGDKIVSFAIGSIVALKMVVAGAFNPEGPYSNLTNLWFHDLVGPSNRFYRTQLEIQ